MNGAFLNGGVLWSPTALDEDGLLFKFLLSGGLYRYDAGDLGGERVIGSEWQVQVLPGWHVKRGTFEAKVFWGPEYQRLGAHVTSMKTGDAEWSAAGGWSVDTNNRSSPYLRLGFMQRVGGD